MMYMEFEKVTEQEGMDLVDISTTAAREHLGEIEWRIWYVKERSRCTTAMEYMLKSIVIYLVYNVILFVIVVPDTLGTSEAKQLSMSLQKIVSLYARGGFTVCTIMMYMQFEKVTEQEGMDVVDIDTTAAR